MQLIFLKYAFCNELKKSVHPGFECVLHCMIKCPDVSYKKVTSAQKMN